MEMADTEAYLTSEKFVKSMTNVDDNLAGKFIKPSIREAQDINLREILGAALKRKLQQIVADGTEDEPENSYYKALLDEIQYYLAYTVIVDIMHKQSKIANAGVVKTPDERVTVAGETELASNIAYYQSKADSYAYLLQAWLLKHCAEFPELGPDEYCRLKANYYSAATCGVWLGGPRGKKVPGPVVRREGR